MKYTMQNEDVTRFGKILETLFRVYEKSLKPDMAELWFGALRNRVTIAELEKYLPRIFEEEARFPLPARIIECIQAWRPKEEAAPPVMRGPPCPCPPEIKLMILRLTEDLEDAGK